jgi:hypothetical protein
MGTLNELERRVAALERGFVRVITLATDPLGATPEATYGDSLESPAACETVQLSPFPGCELLLPPGCCLALANEARDPVMIGGSATPIAVKVLQALRAAVLAQGGGILLFDPKAATGGLIITASGVNVIGTLLNNGSPVVP